MGGGAKIKKYSETKNDYIFILFYQILKQFSLYKFWKNSWHDFGAPLRAAPGGSCPPAPPPSLRHCTALALHKSLCCMHLATCPNLIKTWLLQWQILYIMDEHAYVRLCYVHGSWALAEVSYVWGRPKNPFYKAKNNIPTCRKTFI